MGIAYRQLLTITRKATEPSFHSVLAQVYVIEKLGAMDVQLGAAKRVTCWAGVLDVMAAEERRRPMLGLMHEALLCLLALQNSALLSMLLHRDRLCWFALP